MTRAFDLSWKLNKIVSCGFVTLLKVGTYHDVLDAELDAGGLPLEGFAGGFADGQRFTVLLRGFWSSDGRDEASPDVDLVLGEVGLLGAGHVDAEVFHRFAQVVDLAVAHDGLLVAGHDRAATLDGHLFGVLEQEALEADLFGHFANLEQSFV